MNNQLNIINDDKFDIPSLELLNTCFEIVRRYHDMENAYVNINIVSNKEIQDVNNQYRHKNKPTNIISFPFDKPEGLPDNVMNNFLGDIIVAPDVLTQEASEQHKDLDHHWSHIFIHGLLHLLGYDHQNNEEAETMESLEVKLLQQLNINNPYIEKEL